jgi:hypothetical protein
LALSEASEPGILERAETPFQSQNFLLFGHIFNFEYDELKLTIKEVVDNNKVRLTGSLAFGQDIDNANFFKSVWLSWKGEMRKGRRTLITLAIADFSLVVLSRFTFSVCCL